MPFDARVAVVPKASPTLRIESVQLPDPGAHQVVVKLHASGVCHSQLHEIHTPRERDAILGHEAVGTVAATGSAVDHVKAGDRVFVTWLPRTVEVPTRRPDPAMIVQASGREAGCQGVFTWADHTIVDELYVVKVPDDTNTDVTSIIGCAVMTGSGAVMNTAGVKKGDSVAMFGVGGVGLCAITAARVLGADPIIAVDLDPAKLEMARRHGATEVIDASKTDPVARIRELTQVPGRYDLMGGEVAGVDFAFDCIGAPATGRQLMPSLRSKTYGSDESGRAVVIGALREDLTVTPADLIVHEKQLTGCLGGSCKPERDFPIFLEWFATGALDLEGMVTRRYALDEINDAVDSLERGEIAGRAILVF